MCPLCFTTAIVIAGSATGTGGLATLIGYRISRPKTASKNQSTTEEENDANRN
jgi:hypothetical protein